MTDENLEIQVKLTIDDSEVDPAIAKVAAKSGKQMPSPKMGLDTAAAQQKLGQVDAKAKTVQGTLAKSTSIKVDAAPAHRGIEEIKAHFVRQKADIEALAIKPKVVGGGGPVGGMTDFSQGMSAGRGGAGSALGGFAGMSTMGKLGIAGGVAAIAAPVVIGGMSKLTGMAAQDKRMTDFTAKSLGGTTFVDSAKRLSDATGFVASDFMQAAIAGKGLQQAYGLQTDQVAKLVQVSADLAATSPYEDLQTVTKAMGGLKAAMGGDTDAAQRLGLTLDDVHMKNVAFGGSLRDTWDGLDKAGKAQAYYTEGLRQTQSILGKSADETDVSTQMRKLNAEVGTLGTELGKNLVPAMIGLVKIARELVDAIPPEAGQVAGGAAGVVAFVASNPSPKEVGEELQKVVPWVRTGVWDFSPREIERREKAGLRAHPESTGKMDIILNVNNNNNSQIDASASAPAPH